VASLILIVAMFVLLWVLLIRPQRQRQQQQHRMIESIDIGDEILTVGGIYGIVEEFDEEDDLVVEIAEGIRVRVARRAVAAVVKPEEALEAEEEEAENSEEAEFEPALEAGVNDREGEVGSEPAEDTAPTTRS
jgi:preprotein translocase subunit YajC